MEVIMKKLFITAAIAALLSISPVQASIWGAIKETATSNIVKNVAKNALVYGAIAIPTIA